MDKKLFEIYDQHSLDRKKFVASSEDQKELAALLNVSEEIKNLSDVTVDENYFSTILPRFRESQQQKKYQFSFRKLSLSSAIAFSTVIMLFFTFRMVQTDSQVKVSAATEETNNSTPALLEHSYIASSDEYSDNVVNDNGVQQEIDKSIYQSLVVQSGESNFVLLKNDNDYDKVLSLLDDNELETVYAQLQQTKIL